jgi:hypothetical protein
MTARTCRFIPERVGDPTVATTNPTRLYCHARSPDICSRAFAPARFEAASSRVRNDGTQTSRNRLCIGALEIRGLDGSSICWLATLDAHRPGTTSRVDGSEAQRVGPQFTFHAQAFARVEPTFDACSVTIATASMAAAAAAGTAAAAAASRTAAAATAATEAATASALLTLLRFVHLDLSPVEHLPVELGDGFGRCLSVTHGHEREATGLPGLPIRGNHHLANLAYCSERGLDARLSGTKRKISDKKTIAHSYLRGLFARSLKRF